MSGNDDDDLLNAALAARVSRLAPSIEPPVDLWPAIASRIGDEPRELESLVRRLDGDVEPEVDLWPGIEARIGAGTKPGPRHARGIEPWLGRAASVAAVAIISGLVSFNFVTSDRTDIYATRVGAPAGDDLWWLTDASRVSLPPAGSSLGVAIGAIRTDLSNVQRERVAIERSLEQDTDNLALHALWQQVYRTELALAGQAERLIEDYQGV